MSSHHIVRDQQEPALVICTLSGIPITVLHSLLEWSPTVICLEESIERYTMYGHKLDFALVSFKNFEKWKTSLSEQQPVDILGLREEEPLTKAFEILKAKGHHAVNLIMSKELLFNSIKSLMIWVTHFDIVINTEESRYIILNRNAFEKWVPENSVLSVVSLIAGSTLQVKGLDAIEQPDEMEERLVKRAGEGNLSIHCNEPPFMIGERYS